MIFQKLSHSEITKNRLRQMRGISVEVLCEEVMQMLERKFHLSEDEYELQIILKQKERRS